ncbi:MULTISPECIES: hypothetical protein [Bradyrhizobium]|uniref:hypothetical protein n=1 Tax=Bradyrhizobium TaxID=374 RepID=UPI001EDA581D|nr:hypothetical protein [Bradyrhizobium zhengyangense]MCG2645201.1 hypothetical protein [Bradyrhizobium zhengyangense]
MKLLQSWMSRPRRACGGDPALYHKGADRREQVARAGFRRRLRKASAGFLRGRRVPKRKELKVSRRKSVTRIEKPLRDGLMSKINYCGRAASRIAKRISMRS